MHKFEFECAGQTFVKCIRRLEATCMHFGGIEFGRGTEFLYAHRGYSELFAGHFRNQIETVAAKHSEPIREVGGGDMLVEHFAYMAHKLIHIVVGLVNVVIYVVAARAIVNQIFHECHDIADIGHGFTVLAFAYHQEFARGYLLQQIVDIPAVAFSENYGGADNVYSPVGMRVIPPLQYFLCLPFRPSIVVERVGGMRFVRVLLVEAIDGDG